MNQELRLQTTQNCIVQVLLQSHSNSICTLYTKSCDGTKMWQDYTHSHELRLTHAATADCCSA